MSITGFYSNANILALGPSRHAERTWPNLSIYVPVIARLDPVRRLYLRFKRSPKEPR